MAKQRQITKDLNRYVIVTKGTRSEEILEITRVNLKAEKLTREKFSKAPNLERTNFFSCKSLNEGKQLYIELLKEKKKSAKNEHLEFIPALILRDDASGFEGLTNELIIQFTSSTSKEKAADIGKAHGLTLEREILISPNTYLFSTHSFPDYALLDLAENLEDLPEIDRVDPNNIASIQQDAYTPNDTLFVQLPHLNLIECDEAWEFMGNYGSNLQGGSPDICIAVFDSNGVHPTHPDLTANLTDGASKMLISWDFTAMQAQTVGNLTGDHGTQCAGSATAAMDNDRGTVGVAPNCRLIGAKLPATLTGVDMADAWLWAAGIDNGNTTPNFPALPTQPADVISNSWGLNGQALPAIIQTAFDTLTDTGRDGKGTLICFSIGNNGYIDFTSHPTLRRMMAAYNRTIAVGASINTNPTTPINGSSHADPNGNVNGINVQVDRRTLFSPFGPSLDVVAPSHTAYTPNLVDPILSTSRVGLGNIDGCPGAPVCNDYALAFGGTSHSCPTVAGLLALILSMNPYLHWEEARDILRRTADRIDINQPNAIGQWTDTDGDGEVDYSQWYGYGRINVLNAVKEAIYLKMAYTNHVK